MDTEQMIWDEIPQEIRDWLIDDADFIVSGKVPFV